MEEKKTVPAKKIKEMVELYRDYAGKHPQGKLTKSVWFSLKKLQDLINGISKETPVEEAGVRFYFGTYNEKEKENIRCRNTLIMVSTKKAKGKDGKTINLDYDVESFVDPVNQGELCPEECGGTDRWGMGG